MRTGNEPGTARSPLRLRLVLALFGLITALVAVAVLAGRASLGVVLLFAVVAVVAAVDLGVVLHHLRQGAHYQPGPRVPPYQAVPPPPREPRVRRQVDEDTRIRRYLMIMGTCLLLITLAWTWVRSYSVPAAVVMSVVAAVLPPVAVIVANFGVSLPDHSSDSGGLGRRPRRTPGADREPDPPGTGPPRG